MEFINQMEPSFDRNEAEAVYDLSLIHILFLGTSVGRMASLPLPSHYLAGRIFARICCGLLQRFGRSVAVLR